MTKPYCSFVIRGHREDGARPFLEVHSRRTWGNGQCNLGNPAREDVFTMMMVENWVTVQRGGGISILGDNQGSVRWNPHLAWFAWSMILDQRPPEQEEKVSLERSQRYLKQKGKPYTSLFLQSPLHGRCSTSCRTCRKKSRNPPSKCPSAYPEKDLEYCCGHKQCLVLFKVKLPFLDFKSALWEYCRGWKIHSFLIKTCSSEI